MKSLKNSSHLVLRKLTQKLSARKTAFSSSLYAGITVSHLLAMLDKDEEDIYVIRVNRLKYNDLRDNFKIVKSYNIKQELVRREFKEKIVVHLSDIDDVLRIAPETKEFKTTYGYVIRTIINITTES